MNDLIENIGRFGHHPDPAIDFEVEVETIENELLNHSLGFENGTPSMEGLRTRIKSAMTFVVGGDQGAIAAKARLRVLEQDYCAPVLPPDVAALAERANKIKSEADQFLANACDPTQKLTILGNHGDIALQMLPALATSILSQAAEIERLNKKIAAAYGDTISVEEGTHGRREGPLTTLSAMVDPSKIVVVEV